MIAVNENITIRTVLKNSFELALHVPIENHTYSVPTSSRLPGLVDIKAAGGLSNIALSANYMAFKGGGRKPVLMLESLIATPLMKMFYGEGTGLRYVPFGLEGWNIYAGPTVLLPLGSKFSITARPWYNIARYDQRSSFSSKQHARENTFALQVEPTWNLNKRGLSDFGISASIFMKDSSFYGLDSNTLINRESGTFKQFEIFFRGRFKDSESRVSAGIALSDDNTPFYYYSLSLLLRPLFFKKMIWW
jgi:hypothetical protein